MPPADKSKAITEALRLVIDPELGINIVSLGLIYGIDVQGDQVVIRMTLTTPGCPLIPFFQQEITRQARLASGLDEVVIDLVFDPPWTPAMMDAEAKKTMAILQPSRK